jgi:hypothetical protein
MDDDFAVRWKYSVYKYRRGTFLLGMNFNTNTDYGEREAYLIFYVGKWSITVGRFS